MATMPPTVLPSRSTPLHPRVYLGRRNISDVDLLVDSRHKAELLIPAGRSKEEPLDSSGRKVEQDRLAIIRYNYVSVEYVRGLSKRQIIGYLVEVATVFPLLHPDALEQESLSFHLHTHGSHIPVAWENFCLPNFKVASLVQVSQQAESESYFLREMTVKPSQSLLFAVDPHLAFHVVENAGLQRGRMKIRVWSKAQPYQVSITTRVVEHKCIRQHLEQTSPLYVFSLWISLT